MEEARSARAREALEVAYAMSNLLKTGLDRPTLAVVMALTEQGVNPEALAAVVKELRREAAALRSASASS